MNKKGNIQITILVIGVIVICGLVLVSTYLGNSATFSIIGHVEHGEAVADQISFYESFGNDKSTILDLLNEQFDVEFVGHSVGYLDNKYIVSVDGPGISIKYYFKT